MRQIFTTKIQLIIVIGALVIGFATAGYFFLQYQNVKNQLANPANFTQTETKNLLAKLGKLIELPENEIPTIATISDRERLQNQPFFTNAKNGDKLVIYTNAKKAIIYDPVANKIIDVAPVNFNSSSATPSATISISKPATSVSPTASPTPKLTPKASPTPNL